MNEPVPFLPDPLASLILWASLVGGEELDWVIWVIQQADKTLRITPTLIDLDASPRGFLYLG